MGVYEQLEAMLKTVSDIWTAPPSPVTGSKYVVDENHAAAKMFAADPNAPAHGDPTLRELYLLTPKWTQFALDAAGDFTDDFGQLDNPLSFYRDLIPSPHGVVFWQHAGLYKGVAWDDDGERLGMVFLANKDANGYPLNLGLTVPWDAASDEYKSHRHLSVDEQIRSQQLRAFAYVVFYLLKNPEYVQISNTKGRITPKGGAYKYMAQYPTLSNEWLSSDGTVVVKSVSLSSGLVQGYASGGHGGVGESPRHQFKVRGHWRNQWYPSTQTHQLKYIHPFIKGLSTGRETEEVGVL